MKIPDRLSFNGRVYCGKSLKTWAERLCASSVQWEKELGEFLQQWTSGNESITAFTSGSTGPAKAIRLNKNAMTASAEATIKSLNLKSAHQALLCLSCRTIAGMMMVVRSMVAEMNLITLPPSGNPLKGAGKKFRADFAAMVPAQVYNCLNDEESRETFLTIGTVIIGGGEISPQLEAQLRELPNALYATYGMTETISHIALRRLNGPERSDFYTALPGIAIMADTRGCLVIDAPRISEQTITTNDLVETEGGNRFRWLGRYDNIINRGGKKLMPESIEKKLFPFIIQRFFIAGLPHEKYGEAPVLLIESAEIPGEDLQLLQKSIAAALSHDETPLRIITVPAFSETESGKINRKETLKLCRHLLCL
jgi:O-succinylbenzoic acid--CoA ligase